LIVQNTTTNHPPPPTVHGERKLARISDTLLFSGGTNAIEVDPYFLCSPIPLLPAQESPMAGAPSGLRCEYLADPVGIDVPQPRLSWVLEHSARGERQTAYQVLVH